MKTVRLGLILCVCGLAIGQQPSKDEPTQGGRPLSAWIEDLKDESPVLREEALEIIGTMGTAAVRAADAIRPLLKDASVSMRLRAAVALWNVEQKEAPILPVLVAAAADSDKNTRLLLLDAIRQTAFNSKEVGGILVECLAGADEAVRFQARSAILHLPDSAAVPALTAGITHKNPVVVQQVLHLASIRGPRAAGAADVIRERLKDRYPRLRVAAAKALWKIVPDDAAVAPVLIELSKSADEFVNSQALSALMYVRPTPEAAIPIFKAALKHRDPRVQVNAARALFTHDQRTRELLPLLLDMVDREPFSNSRSQAGELLGEMTAEAKTIVPAIRETLRTGN